MARMKTGWGPAWCLDRIRIDRIHIVGSIYSVNPAYIDKVEQIHAVDRIAGGDSNQPRSALGETPCLAQSRGETKDAAPHRRFIDGARVSARRDSGNSIELSRLTAEVERPMRGQRAL